MENQGRVKTGEKYNRLTALEFLGTSKNYQKEWLWKCECGNECRAMAGTVRAGNTKSCGCLNVQNKIKHGHYGTLTYTSWLAMKARCYRSNHVHYSKYGGRGIVVCDRWRNSFEAFLEDMGERPTVQHTIDRIDSNGSYEPGNCRWATKKEQAQNRKSNVFVTLNGEVITASDCKTILGISDYKLSYWLRKGLTPDEISKLPRRVPWSPNTVVHCIVNRGEEPNFDKFLGCGNYLILSKCETPDFDDYKLLTKGKRKYK